MNTDNKQMMCGNCGNKTFSIYIDEYEDLTAECDSCKSTTTITVQSKIKLDWGEKSDGILCKS
tara:strand:+ start:3217 stop:3405 length:189 start_codon:yes stop_codon:yes gene_type:complete